MGFAEDKVYTYIRENISEFYCIRVNQLIRELPCLAVADTEEIAAFNDRKGNEEAVWELFIRLRCRRDWVRQLIEALGRTRQEDLAVRIQRVYSAYQVRPQNNAPSPAANNPLPSDLSAHSQVPILAANPEVQYAGSTLENSPSTSSLPRQPANRPGPGAPLPHQSNPSANRSDAIRSSAGSCQDQVDYNAPLQEMKPLAKDKVTEDALTPGREALNPQPTGSVPREDLTVSQESSSQGDGLAPAAVELSPGSRVRHLAPKEGVEVAGPGMPASEPSAQGWDWADCQQHPVCVSGGYFGNMNHLNVGSGRKASVPGESVQRGELAAACGPEDIKNQPEEVYYSSFERSPLASRANRAVHRDGQQAGDLLQRQNFQAVPDSEHGNLGSNTVDVRDSFLPHSRLDAEQTYMQGQGDHGGERDGFPSPQSRDSAQSTCNFGEVGAIKGHSSPEVQRVQALEATINVPPDLSDDATAHDSQVLHLGTTCSTSSSEKLAVCTSTGPSQGIPEQNPGSGVNSSRSGQSRGCLADTLEDDSGPANSRNSQSKVWNPASAANPLCPASAPWPGNTLPTSSPLPPSALKLPSTSPAGEFPDLSDFSSTAVIPPGSPGLPSDFSGAAFSSDLSVLKHPVQESKLPENGTESGNPSKSKENVTRAPKPLSSSMTQTTPERPGSTAGTTVMGEGCDQQNVLPGSPRGCEVFYSNLDEEQQLSKPGVLTSTVDGSREEPANRQPNSQETNRQYSGSSDRFLLSREYSVGSNPLLISDSSTSCSSISPPQSNQPEENHYSSLSDHRPSALAATNGSGATQTSRASVPPQSSSTWNSTDVETHEFQVVEYPSADLEKAASLKIETSAYENTSPALKGSSRHQKGRSNKSGSPCNSEAPSGGTPQNANRPQPGSDGSSFPFQDYVLPAAFAAFISLVAFVFYKQLRN